MKRFILDFLRRGSIAAGVGPIVLAVVYLILQASGEIEALTLTEVCIGIFSLTALAFIAGGMNAVYQIERLPLITAILIHGVVLYIGYLCTYLVNDWLKPDTIAIIIFSAIFAVGFLVIWAIIYSIIRRNTKKLNNIINENRKKHTS